MSFSTRPQLFTAAGGSGRRRRRVQRPAVEVADRCTGHVASRGPITGGGLVPTATTTFLTLNSSPAATTPVQVGEEIEGIHRVGWEGGSKLNIYHKHGGPIYQIPQVRGGLQQSCYISGTFHLFITNDTLFKRTRLALSSDISCVMMTQELEK